jgi:beta-glucosidase
MFRPDFTWGAATAAYQIEGAWNEDGKGPSIWDTFSHSPGKVFGDHTGDVACDHYHRYEEDAGLMADIGLKAYRFSTSWPRIMPAGTGAVNDKGLDFYSRLVDALLAKGITPWLTLFHWDLPQALHLRGGWMNPDMPKHFADYTRAVAERLGDRVRHWMTFNEPQCFLGISLWRTLHAPGIKLPMSDVLQAWHHALLAHGLSVQQLRATCRAEPVIGCAPTNVVPIPASAAAADVEVARRDFFKGYDGDLWTLGWWSDPMILGSYPADGLAGYGKAVPAHTDAEMRTIAQPLDFFGVNLYFGHTVKAGPDGALVRVDREPGHALSRNGWPITPDALYWGPKFLWERYKAPIVITENGYSGSDWVMSDGAVHDPQRVDQVRRYLRAFKRAAAEGVDAMGYFYWSLIDNFEWNEGYKERFGLIHVDYATQRRTLKDSAHWYAGVIAANGANLEP